MTKKKCNDNCACSPMDDNKQTTADVNYGYYSRVLKEPFDTLEELAKAEEVYYSKLKAKEDKAAQKKADALKVEEAFKALNATRKIYKEDLAQLTKEYADALENTKKAFELGKKDIHNALAAAEEKYANTLKEFTAKYPEGYHLTLKDGDFETTISNVNTVDTNHKPVDFYSDILKFLNLYFDF